MDVPATTGRFDASAMKCALIMPTLNAGNLITRWIESFDRQLAKPDKVLIVDSQSNDRTVEIARKAGFGVIEIARSEFNHGGTRQAAADSNDDCDVLIFVTHDVVFADEHSIAALLAPFADRAVGASYGRQLPHTGAGHIGAHARLFNYPDHDRTVGIEDIARMGLKAAFLSNSFAAYRRSALLGVGGFPTRTIMNEDTYVAAKMLLSGWKIAYASSAQVHHSHDYSVVQDFKRYFDIGVFHSRERWLSKRFGRAEGEGFRFLKSEFSYLWANSPVLIPAALAHTFAKYLGYRLGFLESYLSSKAKRRLSMHRAFWD